MSPLRRLILDRMREKGWDPKDVEGRGVKHATLHRYMNPVEMLQLPRRSVLEALAAGLQLPVPVVTQAAKDSVGWNGDATAVETDARPASPPSLSVVPSRVESSQDDEEDDVDNAVLRAIAADPHLDEISREHFTSQYKILRKFTRYRREHERLPYVAHGTREDPVDPEEEARIEAEARRAAQENPHSPIAKRPTSPDGDK